MERVAIGAKEQINIVDVVVFGSANMHPILRVDGLPAPGAVNANHRLGVYGGGAVGVTPDGVVQIDASPRHGASDHACTEPRDENIPCV